MNIPHVVLQFHGIEVAAGNRKFTQDSFEH
jgi:hypothetical protein